MYSTTLELCQKFRNLGQDRTRTKKNLKTRDRTGPEPRKISKPGTGPDQDQQNFENLGPIRTVDPWSGVFRV